MINHHDLPIVTTKSTFLSRNRIKHARPTSRNVGDKITSESRSRKQFKKKSRRARVVDFPLKYWKFACSRVTRCLIRLLLVRRAHTYCRGHARAHGQDGRLRRRRPSRACRIVSRRIRARNRNRSDRAADGEKLFANFTRAAIFRVTVFGNETKRCNVIDRRCTERITQYE